MLSKTDYKCFNKAKSVAAISDSYKFHIGCIAIYQGIIIGIGCKQIDFSQVLRHVAYVDM